MSLLEVSHLCAGYGGRDILQDVSFAAEAGQLVGVLGANGSGKTTLLKAIGGILPHRGSCTVEGRALEKLSARQLATLCSYVPQRSGITIDLSALDVVLMGYNPRLGLLEHPTRAMRAEAESLLAMVGLPDCAEKNYLHLSEGQKQLCILARTLAADSSLLLLDEPESALDLHHRSHMLALLRQLIADETTPRSGIIVLHDPALALDYCDALLLLEEGRLAGCIHPRQDAPEEMERQLSRIYGAVTLLRCRDHGGAEHFVMLKDREQP